MDNNRIRTHIKIEDLKKLKGYKGIKVPEVSARSAYSGNINLYEPKERITLSPEMYNQGKEENIDLSVVPEAVAELQPEQQKDGVAYSVDTSSVNSDQGNTIGELPQNPEAIVAKQPVEQVAQPMETAQIESAPEAQMTTSKEPSLNNIFAEDKAINEAIATLEALMSRGIRETLAVSFNRAATIYDSQTAKRVEEEQKTKIELEQREMNIAQEKEQLAKDKAEHNQNVAQANEEIAATVTKVNSENEAKIAETNDKADQILVAANTKAAQTIKAGEEKAEALVTDAKVEADKTLNTVKKQLEIVADHRAAVGMPQPTPTNMEISNADAQKPMQQVSEDMLNPFVQTTVATANPQPVVQSDLATTNTQPQQMFTSPEVFTSNQGLNPLTAINGVQPADMNQNVTPAQGQSLVYTNSNIPTSNGILQ